MCVKFQLDPDLLFYNGDRIHEKLTRIRDTGTISHKQFTGTVKETLAMAVEQI